MMRKLCPTEQKILDAIERSIKWLWNLAVVKWFIAFLIIGLLVHKLALFLGCFSLVILLRLLIKDSERVKAALVVLLVVALAYLIFKPEFNLATPSFNLSLGIVSISNTQQKIAPLFYTIKEYIKYDPMSKPSVPFVVIYPVSFQLKYNANDDIYHGEIIVLVKNIGHKEAKIIDEVNWKIDSTQREGGFSSPINSIRHELKRVDEDKNLIDNDKRILRNKYNFLMSDIQGKGKILYPNSELVVQYAPQLEAGKNIKGIITLTIEVKYELPNRKQAISKYCGDVAYNSEVHLGDKKYYFQPRVNEITFEH